MKDLYKNEEIVLQTVSDYISRYNTGAAPVVAEDASDFQDIILTYYEKFKRSFPWRGGCTPYEIFISEVMLQQTQTDRVVDKYISFIKNFPTAADLASASLGDVLAQWQGLGYNRRAGFLHRAAKMIVEDYNGAVPDTAEDLILLPGIGRATASSIAAFAYDRPEVFIETNIRTVFIYFFFSENTEVHDRDIYPLVEQTLYRQKPSLWYSALMDFGVMLKKNSTNPSRKSKHYTKQSRFKGSLREARGLILKELICKEPLTVKDFAEKTGIDLQRAADAAESMTAEGLIVKKDEKYFLP